MIVSFIWALLIGLVINCFLTDVKLIRSFGTFFSIVAAWLFFTIVYPLFVDQIGNFYILIDNDPISYVYWFSDSLFAPAVKDFWFSAKPAFMLDGLSVVFVSLTVLVFPACFLAAWSIGFEVKRLFGILLFLEIVLTYCFITADLFWFYVFFEAMLIPFFKLIFYWGSRERKIRAAHYFVFYTYISSLLMYFGVVYLDEYCGDTSNIFLSSMVPLTLSSSESCLLWWLLFPVLATKIPLYPVHGWLPEAHVEAPAVGSMILASVILKVGCFGCLRYLVSLLPQACFEYWNVVAALSVFGVLFASACAIRQVDIKRIIAYSSVAHMSFVTLGMFSYSEAGLLGSLYLMVGHGVVSAALFFCIGVLYDRYGTRLLYYYSGLLTAMPFFGFFIFAFAFANMSFPGTCNFIGEFSILVGLMNNGSAVLVMALIGTFLAAIYSLLGLNKIFFGTLNIVYIRRYTDLTLREFVVLAYFFIAMLILGVSDTLVTQLVLPWTDFNI
jgi:NADH-quinone oxidoreductase subunit M